MQPERRRFLTMGGLAAAGLSLARSGMVRAQTGPGPLVIDCQSHLYVPEIVSLMEKRTQDPVVYS